MPDQPQAEPLVEQLFRREYAQIVAGLTRRLGPARLELAEDVAQEALVRALRTWSFEGIPERPGAWLAAVAWRLAVDHLRRDRGEATVDESAVSAEERSEHSDDEDLLRLMLLCCHPRLPLESRLALVLKTACGFGNVEIAAGLLAAPDAIKRRLSRAHAALREESVELDPSDAVERRARLDALLLALYLLFTEGYAAAREPDHVRSAVVDEALRMARLVAGDPVLGDPRAQALAALFCLQAARSPARVDSHGVPLSLAEQDRAGWDPRLLAEGFARLERAAQGQRESRFHLEAAIAATHAAAPTWTATDWPSVLALYDRLLERHPSPVVALNRCVALAQVEGAAAGLAALEAIDPDLELPLRSVTAAQLHWLAGDLAEAQHNFERALATESSPPRRKFLERRLAACRSGAPPLDW